MLRHRELAGRDCGICQEFLIDETNGKIQTYAGRKQTREEYRDKNSGILPCPPMCRRPEGCPKGSPENSRALWPSNERCYEHYLECKAVGSFPDDPIVRRNAAIIADVIKQSELLDRQEFELSLVQLASYGRK